MTADEFVQKYNALHSNGGAASVPELVRRAHEVIELIRAGVSYMRQLETQVSQLQTIVETERKENRHNFDELCAARAEVALLERDLKDVVGYSHELEDALENSQAENRRLNRIADILTDEIERRTPDPDSVDDITAAINACVADVVKAIQLQEAGHRTEREALFNRILRGENGNIVHDEGCDPGCSDW